MWASLKENRGIQELPPNNEAGVNELGRVASLISPPNLFTFTAAASEPSCGGLTLGA